MPKMKRAVLPAVKPHDDVLIDGSKTGFKNRKRLQRSQKLAEENEAKRKQLKEMKKQRSVLLAEVRFLRRRYKLLTEIKAEQVKQTETTQPLEKPTPVNRKERTDKCPAPSGLKQKCKSSSKNDGFERSQRQKGDKNRVIATRLPHAAYSVMQNEVLGKESRDSKVAQVFDLNETWREEKELLGAGKDETRMYIRSGIGEEHLGLKPSVCGANRMEKRRISWLDPLALRVSIL